MFREPILSTPFTTQEADTYFQNITGESFNNDVSFLSTIRALFGPRMKKEDELCLTFLRRVCMPRESAALRSAADDITYVCGDLADRLHDTIIIYGIMSSSDSSHAFLDLLPGNFEAAYPGYRRLEKVTALYRKSFRVDCYINPERKNAVVLVERLNYQKLHYLQMSALALLPWYFDPKGGVSEAEMELLNAMRERTPGKYNACLTRMAEVYNFRDMRIRRLLSGFERSVDRAERSRVQSQINDFDRSITDLNERIAQTLTSRNEACVRLMGLETRLAGEDKSEIMEYFLCNQKLRLDDVQDGEMLFVVSDYLTYFDSEMAQATIDNPHGLVYQDEDGDEHGVVKAETMRRLLTEIFVSDSPRLRIRFCAAYSLRLNGNVDAIRGYQFGDELSDCMPNPHINRYACLGSYNTTINRLLQNGDYIGAIEQCVASCKSLNWADSTVMRAFMDELWGDEHCKNRCVELPDGRVVNPTEAIQWLEKQDPAPSPASEEMSKEDTDEQAN